MDDMDFQKGITAMNRSMKQAKSEMRASMRIWDEAGDSLKSLGAKQDGLSKQLQIQEKIVEENRKKYDELARSGKANTKVTQDQATKVNRSIEAYKALEMQLNKTQADIDKEKSAMAEMGNQATKTSEKMSAIGKVGRLFGLNMKSGMDQAAKSSESAGQGIEGAFGGIGKMSTIAKAGIASAVAALGTVAVAGIKASLDMSAAQGRFQAQLGATQKQAKKFEDVAIDVYGDNWADSMDDAANAVAQVKQNMQGLAKTSNLKSLTEDAQILNQTFGYDVAESTRSVATLMKNFGVSGSHAFDLITVASQKGANFSGELLDTINEYSVQFKGLGLSADDMFNILVQGSKNGSFNLDKMADSVKELSLRVVDGSATTKAGFQMVGLNANTMSKNFAAGGESARRAFIATVTALASMKDPLKQQQAGVALFGTQWEDVKKQAITSMDLTKNSLGSVNGATKKAGDALSANLGSTIKQIGHEALVSLKPMGDWIASGLQTGLKAFNDFKAQMATIWSGIKNLWQGNTGKGISILQGILTPNQINTVISGINAVKQSFSSFRKYVFSIINAVKPQFSGVLNSLKAGFTAALPALKATGAAIMGIFKTLAPYVKAALTGIASFIGSIARQIGNFWKQNGAAITQAIHNIGVVMNAVFKVLMPIIAAIVKSVWGNIKGVITGALTVIGGVVKVFAGLFSGNFKEMWSGVKDIFSGGVKFVWNLINLWFVGKMLKGIKAVGTGIKNIFKSMWAGIKSLWSSSGKWLDNLTDKISGWIKNGFKSLSKNVINTVKGLWNNIKSAWNSSGKFISNLTGKIGSWVKNGFSNMKNKALDTVKSLWSNTAKYFGKMVDGAKALPSKIGSGIKNMAGKALSGVKYMGNKMMSGLAGVVNGITQKGINWILGKLDVPKKYKVPKWNPPHFETGVSGFGGGLAVVGDGNKHRTRELVSTPNGGLFLTPNQDTLVNLPKGSSVLPNEMTEQVLSSGILPQFKTGLNIGGFISNTFSKVKSAVGDVFDYISNPGKLVDKVVKQFGTNFGVTGIFGDMAKGAYKKTVSGMKTFVKNMMDKFGDAFTGTGSTKDVKRWVAKALSITHTSSSWAGALETIAMKESGGNPRAINLWDSNARAGHPSKGLMQMIDSTFRAHMKKGYDNILNPIDNVVSDIGYIKVRYGSVFNVPGIKALKSGGRYIGYAGGTNNSTGGKVIVGEGDEPEVIQTKDGRMRLVDHAVAFNDFMKNSMVTPLSKFPHFEEGVRTSNAAVLLAKVATSNVKPVSNQKIPISNVYDNSEEIALLKEQNKLLLQLIAGQQNPIPVNINTVLPSSRTMAKYVKNDLTTMQQRDQQRTSRAKGVY